jgi:peptide deformylase
MAVLRIAKMGNPVLAQAAAPVADPGAPEIRRLAADMIETLEDIGASGLAAPQVFVSKRVVVYRMIAARIPKGSGIEPRPWTVMVNPMITPRTEDKTPVMTDLGLLAYNDEPGQLAREVAADPTSIDPLFVDLVERWPGRSRWFGDAARR